MHRRQFLRSVPFAAAAASGASFARAEDGFPHGEPHMKRWDEQRWVLDNIIQANGVDWDQGHTSVLLRACGLDVQGEMTALRQRVRKYADIVPAFEQMAIRREAKAMEFEKDDALIPARDNYYIAAAYWATAMWGLEEHGPRIRRNNTKKRENFSKYIKLADHKIEQLHLDETRSEFEPAVSRDGRYLAFVQNRGNLSLAMVIKDLMTGTQVDIPPGGGFSGMHSPAFAPDNSRVLYSYPEEGRQHLFAVGIDAKNPTRLVDSSGVNNWPSYSPDGREVVFSSTRDGDYDLYVMKSDGTNVRRLTDSPKQDIRPRWSPDGQRIAFTSNRDGNYEIYLIAPNGTGLSRVTNHPEQDDFAAWHPDGRRLVIVAERDGHQDLVLVDVP